MQNQYYIVRNSYFIATYLFNFMISLFLPTMLPVVLFQPCIKINVQRLIAFFYLNESYIIMCWWHVFDIYFYLTYQSPLIG